jgi:hypothetical protein
MYCTILSLVIETHGMNEYSDTKVQITWKMRQRHNTKKIDWYSTERCHNNLSNPCGTWRLEKALLLKQAPSAQIAPSCHLSMPQPRRKLSKDSGLLEGRNPGLIIVGVDASMMTGPLYRVRTVAPKTHTKMPSTLACPLLCLNWTSSILKKVERSTLYV